ncbi:MAG: formylmethanofuran dehydrogenase subunit C [Gemmatimonadales bacterium]
MSDTVVLALRGALERTLEADCIVPDRFAAAGAKEIGDLRVWYGGQPAQLGDFFTVRGERARRVRIEGQLDRVEGVGAGMTAGELVIEGNAGRDVGMQMAGGTIEIRGDAGDNAGGAGPGASRGMSGGEIIIHGSTGAEAGAAMRRGLIVIGGNAGERAGRGMIAGSVVVLGAAARGAGRWIKRGTIVALGPVEPPATFRYACTYRPLHLRVTFLYLRDRYGLPIADRYVTGRYHRYSGDLAELGKGEILRWAAE